MKKDNRWRHGTMALDLPPIPTEYKGRSACHLQTATLDKAVGDEVLLVIQEDADYGAKLARLNPFHLRCKSGMIRTSHGLVLFLLFRVSEGKRYECAYELFLNPHEMATVQLLSCWGQQSHIKVLLVESSIGQCLNWYEIVNVFGMDEVVAGLARVIGHEPAGDFALAQREVTRDYTLEMLMEM